MCVCECVCDCVYMFVSLYACVRQQLNDIQSGRSVGFYMTIRYTLSMTLADK